MPSDWKAKLFVSVITADGQQLLTPIVDINPTFNTPNVPEHSLEGDGVGVTMGNDTFAFNLTVKALRDQVSGTNPAEVMSKLQLKHEKFNIVIVERDTNISGGKNWAFDSLMLEDCYVNTGSPSRATLGTSPVAVFNCMCLGVNVDGEYYNGFKPPA